MRILFVAHRVPYPPNKGDKIRSFHEIRFLSRRHEIDLAAFYDDPADAAFEKQLGAFCRSVTLLPLSKVRQMPMALIAMACGRPGTLGYYASRRMRAEVNRLFRERRHDAALGFSSSVAPYIDRLPTRRVLDFVDSDASKWDQYAKASSFPRRLLYRYEAGRLSDFEFRMMRKFDASVFVAPRELAWLGDSGGLDGVADRVHFVPNGVDLDYFTPAPGASPDPDVIFTGAMDYYPNVDGVCHFAESVFPLVRARISQARFFIVGSRPAPAVRALDGKAGVVVTGGVPDVRPYLHRARVAVVPLRISQGLQNKVLEALATGLPVVTTPEVAGGLHGTADLPLFVENDPPSMAARIVEHLQKPRPPAEAAGRIREALKREYSWDTNLMRLESLLERSAQFGRQV
jgi:polysaccharide biosynthesis protein PslH